MWAYSCYDSGNFAHYKYTGNEGEGIHAGYKVKD